jgi:hypothetical protein
MAADRFSKMDVTVTLTGEEWFAIVSRLARKELSRKGAQVYLSAQDKLQEQLSAASEAARSLGARRARTGGTGEN